MSATPDHPTPHHSADAALEQVELLQRRIGELTNDAAAGQVGGLVAHEVRNLLTPAIAYVQLAQADPGDPSKTERALGRSLVAMRRACDIAELILAIVKGADSENPPTEPVADVGAAVADCLASLGWDDRGPGFDLEIEVPQGLAAAIAPDALRHILMNLLLNARAAVPEHAGRITIHAQPLQPAEAGGSTWNSAGRSGIRLEIRDNGRGIDAARLSRILSALQSERSLSQHARGNVGRGGGVGSAGLGLVLCEQLLARCGGSLRLDSHTGRGTSAKVQLRAA